jgi:hypothetical protein
VYLFNKEKANKVCGQFVTNIATLRISMAGGIPLKNACDSNSNVTRSGSEELGGRTDSSLTLRVTMLTLRVTIHMPLAENQE